MDNNIKKAFDIISKISNQRNKRLLSCVIRQTDYSKAKTFKNKNAYDVFNFVTDYLYEIFYSEIDYEYAKKYFKKEKSSKEGMCSSVRKNNLYGRNFDWTYDENAEFIVHTDGSEDRYKTLGIASGLDLTNDFVKSEKYSDLYKVVPFVIKDGINEFGLIANINVTSQDKGITYATTPLIETKKEISTTMVVRYIIDNFKDAKSAVEYLRDYVSIYTPKKRIESGYELHYMIADKDNTYIIEFVDGEMVILEVDDNPYMTNFHISDVTLNDDGTVTINRDGSGINESGVTSNGSGLERFNIIANNYESINDIKSMRELMDKIKYTNTYTLDGDDYWYTEFTDSEQIDVTSPIEDFVEIISVAKDFYDNRSRDSKDEYYGTWQTVHSSIYDIDSKKLYVVVQEDSANEFEFSL